MDRTPTEDLPSGSALLTATPPESRTLREVVQSSRRIGGNYGSLAKAQVQPVFYITHKVETNDTLQRLALKYSINIQEIKRVNKLWSDAELGLLEHVYIPVNTVQLMALRNIYPTLDVVQNLSPSTNHRTSSMNGISSDDLTSSIRSSDSSTSIPTTATNSSFQDYFSKIDQQIQQTKQSLQTMDNKERSSNSNHDNYRRAGWDNGRHKGAHHLSDNSVFVNITSQNSREKHVSSALKRLQQEKDNFDEL